jgi:hypothetical protein
MRLTRLDRAKPRRNVRQSPGAVTLQLIDAIEENGVLDPQLS